MRKMKNNLDEMQEQKLLKIEHNGMWFAFWGLVIAIIVQVAVGKEDLFRSIAGEWIILMCLCIYIAVGCIKNNIWDRKLKPNLKTNVIASIISGAVVGGLFFTKSFVQYNKPIGSIVTGVFMFIIVFSATLVLLSICSLIYKKRVQKAEESIDKDSDEI